MVDPKTTRFKAMSWEEQATSLEKMTQEILRTREGRVASEPGEVVGDPQEAIEAAEVYQESLVQIRDSPEVQVVQGMGGLMWQQAQLLMKWMQDNPDLIITPRLPTDSPEGSPTEPSGPDFTNLGNTNGSDDPESTTSPVNSPVGGMTQPETGRVSVETCVPNPLSKLITIYSDDESPESSHDNPVRVQEEKGPEKTSSPEPEVKTKEVPQKETEAESGLETKEPDTSETRADLKDKPELDEPKKESPRKEINGSVANEQVSNKSVPDVAILLNTQTPDE
jgi:hypothetical protein